MKPWWFGAMGVCVVAACSSGARVPEARAPSSANSGATAHVTSPEKADSNVLRASPERPEARRSARSNELSAPGLDDRFAVARQVTALERSIELYQVFIERAGNDPQYEEAVHRSRARIDDAKVTICFLLEKPCDGAGDR